MTRWLAALSIVAACVSPAAAGDERCLSGTVSATISNDPMYFGLWQYTVLFRWNLPTSTFGPFSVHLPLETCPCRCEADIIRFTPVAGSLTNADSCSADVVGAYACGDSTPENPPSVTFTVTPGSDCMASRTGSGSLTFYSALAPGLETTSDVLVFRDLGLCCMGPLTGSLPFCAQACVPLAAENRTWSLVKRAYR